MATGSIKAVESGRTLLSSSYGACNYTRYGKAISIHADYYIPNAISANGVIASGLPVPIDATNAYKVNEGLLVSDSGWSKIYVDGNGRLISATTSITGYCGVQLTYICT